MLHHPTFVKGYIIDWGNIKRALDITDPMDLAIGGCVDEAFQIIYHHVDLDLHPIVTAQFPPAPGESIGRVAVVIVPGKEAFSYSSDGAELREKDVPLPGYLKQIESYLEGPEFLEFVSW